MSNTNANTLSEPATLADDVVLDVRELTQEFTVPGKGGGTVSAVDRVSFQVKRGETLGLVGESGCGKSTTARAILHAVTPTSGSVIFGGVDLTTVPAKQLRAIRSRMQMVFQDPFSSLNPAWRVRELIAEPLVIQHRGTPQSRRERVDELLHLVGLEPNRFADRQPRQLSGGQAQRIGIARALALEPELVVCDESVSSLDVSIQAQVLNLFERLKTELGLTYLFIAHDLGVVKHVSDRMAVMYLGRVAEIGSSEGIYRHPTHPYTAALLASVPEVDIETIGTTRPTTLRGELPSPIHPPSGCRFRTRCPRAQDVCATETPALRPTLPGQEAACHFPILDGGPEPAESVK